MSQVKRSYDASRRQESARENRRRILAAARERFLRDGYAATTIIAIAGDAAVAPQTVTKQFGNKPGLVKALFDYALVGDDDGSSLEEREDIIAIHRQPDPHIMLRRYAEALAAMLPRTAPLQLLLREASGDEEVAEVWSQIRAGRLVGMTNLATTLRRGKHLRPGMSADEARDILWTYSSPELYELLVMNRGWTVKRYADFLASSVSSALLKD